MRSLTVTPAQSKSVVITGASSGLGRAAAIRLGELGYRVFAGVRTVSGAAELSGMPSSRGELIPVTLDVTDVASIAQAGELVERSCKDTGLWAVVNNAGIAIGAPLECVPMDVLRMQLETNVVGSVAIAQRFLPLLRASGGRIVNVTSGIANVTPPYSGAYAAAQFAKEGLSDALRRELRMLLWRRACDRHAHVFRRVNQGRALGEIDGVEKPRDGNMNNVRVGEIHGAIRECETTCLGEEVNLVERAGLQVRLRKPLEHAENLQHCDAAGTGRAH